MVYGATGFSGGAIAARLIDVGHNVVLAGRNAAGVEARAGELHAPSRVFDLRDPDRVEAGLAGITTVLNAAGPFQDTASQMMDACVRTGVHYLDLSGEWPVFAEAQRRGPEAEAAGVMLMPGVGSTIVVSDCLLAAAKKAAPGTRAFRVAHAYPRVLSRGTLRSALRLASPGFISRRGGAVRWMRAGAPPRWFNFGNGDRRCMAVSAPEVITGQHTTGVGNVEVYLEASVPVEIAAGAGALAVDLFGPGLMQASRNPLAALWPRRPEEAAQHRAFLAVVVEAEDQWRRLTRFGLRTPDGYLVTTDTAQAVVERVLTGEHPPGFQTPAGAFGPDLIHGLSGVQPYDAGRPT
jgi:saccharopine dehydrogenase (NAD+, L-lysine-forming)